MKARAMSGRASAWAGARGRLPERRARNMERPPRGDWKRHRQARRQPSAAGHADHDQQCLLLAGDESSDAVPDRHRDNRFSRRSAVDIDSCLCRSGFGPCAARSRATPSRSRYGATATSARSTSSSAGGRRPDRRCFRAADPPPTPPQGLGPIATQAIQPSSSTPPKSAPLHPPVRLARIAISVTTRRADRASRIVSKAADLT
jgi:hypothetical protein